MERINWGRVRLDGYLALLEAAQEMEQGMVELGARLERLEAAGAAKGAAGNDGGTAGTTKCERMVIAELGGGWQIEAVKL